MIDSITKLEQRPDYLTRLGKMALIAEKIIDSEDPFDYTNEILKTLDHLDAYILGMITGEIITGVWFAEWGKVIHAETIDSPIKGIIIGTLVDGYVVRLNNGDIDIIFKKNIISYDLITEEPNFKYEKQLKLIDTVRKSVKHVLQ